MKKVLMWLAVGCLAGCQSAIPPLVRSDVRWKREWPDGSKAEFRSRDPKDRVIGSLRISQESGMVEITNLTSAANVDALQARQHEATQQRMAFDESMRRLEGMFINFAAMQSGRPLPGSSNGSAVDPSADASGIVMLGPGALLVPTNQVESVAASMRALGLVERGAILPGGRQFLTIKPKEIKP